ncbi:MAG: chromate resistance protein [Gammaproteobacteria bacterium]|nr:chromate resistance protein [Gammaproteobacteria bacterium]
MNKQYFFTLLFLIFALSPMVKGDTNSQHLYVSWQGAEADKAASTWLIKHVIDQQAEFKFQPYGSIINEGFAFDVPTSKFSRNHKQSTFDTLLIEYQLSDPILVKIAGIIHEIEINTWRPKVLQESILVDEQWLVIQKHYEKQVPPLECVLGFFDHLYQQLKLKTEPFEMNENQIAKFCLNIFDQ